MIRHHSDRSRTGTHFRATVEASIIVFASTLLVVARVPSVSAAARGGIQTSATSVRPSPEQASSDRATPYYDGCFLGKSKTRSPACVYGDARSRTTVALFGDSHAMQFFPAVERIAIQRGWRLVVLTKSACPSADVSSYRGHGRPYHACDSWRRATLRRMAEIYARRFADQDGRIRSTFEIVWLSGWAPHDSQQKPLRPGSAQASLADAVRNTKR